MRYIRFFIALFSPKMPIYFTYMLQQVEYNQSKFLKWLFRFPIFTNVIKRKTLQKTVAAQSLIVATYIIWILVNLSSVLLLRFSIYWAILFMFSPLISIGIVLLMLIIARLLIIRPKEKILITKSNAIFANSHAIKIAVAGSYGKTTMKHLLDSVLSQKFNVATTPGNMNTPIAHARFADKLSGSEDIIVLEYGEGKPGDISAFTKNTQPEYAIITGIAPNHLDQYKTIDLLANDLFSLREYISNEKLYISSDSVAIEKYLKKDDETFSRTESLGWKISAVYVSIDGTRFIMKRKSKKIVIKSKLLGFHQVAPLAFVASLAVKLGMKISEVETAIAKIPPFEHRMSTYLISGACIIDDTYNGNIEGMTAGLQLLKVLKAKRKVYVTPGLVDQGEQTESVHIRLAFAIMQADLALVVLMKNSATEIIQKTLHEHDYQGIVQLIEDPLNFYNNLEKVVAAGDLVLMQNDWTDNYN